MTGRQLVSHFVNYLFKWLISYLFSLLMVGQLPLLRQVEYQAPVQLCLKTSGFVP